MRTAAFAICLVALCGLSSVAGAADPATTQCGGLFSRVVEKKNGDFTHEVQVYVRSGGRDAAVFRGEGVGSDQPPRLGCLRNAALVLLVGNPVEAGIFILVFPDGRAVSVMEKDAKIEFHDGRAAVKERMFLLGRQRSDVPPEFHDLFEFGEPG